jgi:glycosyltransferase involved in cell wall biosynthesis
MVLIESMSCGLPVVSFDCECGPKEIITDGVDGFLVTPFDITDLASKICVLVENSQLRKDMGKEAQIKSTSFSSDLIMPMWVKLFNELCLNKN